MKSKKYLMLFVSLFSLTEFLIGQTNDYDIHGTNLVVRLINDSLRISSKTGDVNYYYENDINSFPMNYKKKNSNQVSLIGHTYGFIGPIINYRDTIKCQITDATSLGNIYSDFGFIFEPINQLSYSLRNLENEIIIPVYSIKDLKSYEWSNYRNKSLFFEDFGFVRDVKNYVIYFKHKNGRIEKSELMETVIFLE